VEAKTQIPSFTVSLRGYDREEVDEYLDSLSDALGHVDDTQEQNRRLQAHITRLNARIKDLEDRINADTPKTGAVLGERIGLLLRSAEDTATDTINRAEAKAAEMIAEGEAKVAEAEEAARTAIARGEEQARRIEAAARGDAAEIISEAEARATARTRQIEQWAEQVVSHTRAEEARMLREHEEKRKVCTAELRGLAEQRDSVAATLADLRESLGRALGLVGPPTIGATPDHETAEAVTGDGSALDQASDDVDDLDDVDSVASETDGIAVAELEEAGLVDVAEYGEESDQPVALYDAEAEDVDRTGEQLAMTEPAEEPVSPAAPTDDSSSTIETDDFEAKLEAWVSDTGSQRHIDGGAKHFRRD
jgi:DivIVA domain-containing protein